MSAGRSNLMRVPFREIDAVNCDDFLELLNRSDGQGPLYVDMSQVDYFDSSGIRALVSADKTRRQEHNGSGIELVNLSAAVVQVLQICGLLEYFAAGGEQIPDAS